MNSATTESTPSSTKTDRSASANSSGEASALRVVVVTACRPASSQASTASTASASELPTTATRTPAGSGWVATSWATSNITWIDSTRITPARLKSASTAAAGAWDTRTRCPCGASPRKRPDLTTTTGLRRDSRRAMRLNLRGLPSDSR